MSTETPGNRAATSAAVPGPPSARIVGALVLLGLVAALVTYKASGSLATIAKVQASHTLQTRPEVLATATRPAAVRPLLRTLNYLAIVWPALVFGILIGAAVRALVPSAWISGALGVSSLRSQLAGGLAGAPLMLCSCCIAPVFAAIHERTRQAGPAGALLLASPSLNPAALVLTFMLFTPGIAVVRTLMAVVLVFGVSALAARYFGATETSLAPCPLEMADQQRPADVLASFGRDVVRLGRTTLPLIVAGVLLSALLVEVAPMERLREAPLRLSIVVVVALVSVPLALPTFAEIPLALGLLAAGAPAGAAAALLIAGPAINFPSLLTVSRMTTPRYAMALAAGTFVVAVTGGLLV